MNSTGATSAMKAAPTRVEGLRNAIARSPSLSFVDVAAKLQIAETQTPDHDMIRSAMADLRRLRAEIRHA